MKRSFVVVVVIGLVWVCSGCKDGRHPAEDVGAGEAPSVEQLKPMISRAASIPVEAFDAITRGPISDPALRWSHDQPLTLMMLAMTFDEAERDIEVTLPRASGPRPLSAPPRQLIINILLEGQVVIAGKIFADEKSLRELLTRLAKTAPDRSVLIRCDKRARYGHVGRVLALCHEAGIDAAKISMALPGDDLVPDKPAPAKPGEKPGPGVPVEDNVTSPAKPDGIPSAPTRDLLEDIALPPPGGDADKAATPPEPAAAAAPPEADVAPAPPKAPPEKTPTAEKAKDIRFLFPDGMARADLLARALRGRGKPPAADAGKYVSVIWPEYVTKCTRNVTGDTITGRVSFRAEGVYEGTVEYTAGLGPDGWRIEEFRLPVAGRRTVLTVRGTWMATPNPE